MLVTYDDYRVGVLDGAAGQVRDVCGLLHAELAEPSPDHPRGCLPRAALELEEIVAQFRARPVAPRAPRELHAPVPRPVNIFAAPVNYAEHRGELGPERSPVQGTAKELGLFVKAVGSVCGPGDRIELPDMPGREFHYEGEIALVIGREAEDVPPDRALDVLAGVTAAMDITLRLDADHREERTMRKSYRTFTPLGPALAPMVDEETLLGTTLEMRHNGELRQHGSLRELIVGVRELVALASSVVRLLPGDVILTGTPSGVGSIVPGDRLELTVGALPPLSMDVVARPSRRQATS